jgi:hypothetical protein
VAEKDSEDNNYMALAVVQWQLRVTSAIMVSHRANEKFNCRISEDIQVSNMSHFVVGRLTLLVAESGNERIPHFDKFLRNYS